MNLRFLNLGLIGAGILAGLILCLIAIPLPGALVWVVFALWPLGVSISLTRFAEGKVAHTLLAVGNLLFFAWFLYVYMETFHWNPAPKDQPGPPAAASLLFVGFFSLPFFAAFWGIAVATTLATRKRLGMPELGT